MSLPPFSPPLSSSLLPLIFLHFGLSLFPSLLLSILSSSLPWRRGDLNFKQKTQGEKLCRNIWSVFPPSLFWEMSSTPKKRFQKKQKVADYSQTMPAAPFGSSKSLYCCCGYLCCFFLQAPPGFLFISAQCWGLVRKWGQGCRFGPRSTYNLQKFIFSLKMNWNWNITHS